MAGEPTGNLLDDMLAVACLISPDNNLTHNIKHKQNMNSYLTTGCKTASSMARFTLPDSEVIQS